MAEKLGRFGHHPDPAIDFCVEVECIEGLAWDVGIGLADLSTVSKRAFTATLFRVGGDPGAVTAMHRLREIEASLSSKESRDARGKETE